MNLLEKVLAGSGVLIAIYLVVTNPTGTDKAANSISNVFTSGVKALQAR